MATRRRGRKKAQDQKPEVLKDGDPRVEPDWQTPCDVCRSTPTVPLTGMCGPCTFGEAETAGGNW